MPQNVPYRSGAKVLKDRCRVTNFVLIATSNTAPSDASVPIGQCALWFDSTAGVGKINYKAKDAAGTVTTGQLN